MSLKNPIIVEVEEKTDFIKSLKMDIEKQSRENSNLILSYPTVYIHEWKKPGNDQYDIYVGESNDVIERTKEHYKAASDTSKWQNHLLNDGATPRMYIIGHEHFNKSLTLDVENKLIDYIWFMKTISKVHNSRGNQQNEYYLSDEFGEIFTKIWKNLRKKNKELFVSESEIRDSAIFKASPLHKLTPEQLEAKRIINEKVADAIIDDKKGQLIFVQGEAGTGKTVLMSSAFYDLLENQIELFDKPIKCALLVNHDEQITVYNEIAKKLDLYSSFGDEIVSKPTHFINVNDESDPYDVVFVDEGHLLLTQGRQAYRGSNHLLDIMKRSRVTVLVFDENQILTTEEFWEPVFLEEMKKLSLSQCNFIHLEKQLRMQCEKTTLDYIDDITLNQKISPFVDDPKYEIKVFDSPDDLFAAIKSKAKKEKTKLSRMLATYDWDYNKTKRPKDGKKYWGVGIGSFFMPWNRELFRNLNRKEKHSIKNMAWAEQPQTINEIGSTFTIQGFDLSYAGVIIGPSVGYENGKICFNKDHTKNKKVTQNRTLSDSSKKAFAEYFLKHELRILLTRGVNGLYIYAYDKNLSKALKASLNHLKNNDK